MSVTNFGAEPSMRITMQCKQKKTVNFKEHCVSSLRQTAIGKVVQMPEMSLSLPFWPEQGIQLRVTLGQRNLAEACSVL